MESKFTTRNILESLVDSDAKKWFIDYPYVILKEFCELVSNSQKLLEIIWWWIWLE